MRPEDKVTGGPDRAHWIDPLMHYIGVDYRVALLRAAAFHGSTHQAAMVFEVIVPRQLAKITLGRQTSAGERHVRQNQFKFGP